MPTIPAGTSVRDLSTLAGRIAAAWDVLNGRAFGPGTPIAPTVAEADQETPRQWQYPVAVNTVVVGPRRDVPGLTPFEQIRTLARVYDVARLCVRVRTEEIVALPWRIQAKDKKRQTDLQMQCQVATEFWEAPDRMTPFAQWLAMAVREAMEIDALAIYKRPTKSGALYGLDLVDGTTIKPLLDVRGRVAAYQQILYGTPWSDYTRPGYGDDGDEAPIADTYLPHELLYLIQAPRVDSPYGTPPAEDLIIRINMALRKQTQDLAHFTDGNIPPMLISPPDGLMQPEQVRKFEDYFNADLAGEDRARARAKFLPWRADVKELAPFHYGTEIDDWMMKLTLASYGVTPAEIGFTEDVNRSSGESQENVQFRRSGAFAHWLKRTLFDPIIQHDLGYPDLEWVWGSGEAQEDRKMLAESDKVYYEAGAVSSAELRALRYPDLEGPPPAAPPAPLGGAGADAPFSAY